MSAKPLAAPGALAVLALAGCVAVPDAGVRPVMETADTIEAAQTLAVRGNTA